MKLRFSDESQYAVEFEAADSADFKSAARAALREFGAEAPRRAAYLHIWGGHVWYNPGQVGGMVSRSIKPGDVLNFWEPQRISWWDHTTEPSDDWLENTLEAVNATARWLSKLTDAVDALMDSAQPMTEEMTVAEVAETYGIQPGTVRRSVQMGWIPARKSGKTVLIRRADAEARWGKR